ncbi:hypothetical protein GCM10027431_00260 [Lysobacter rhizosphaerae]
MLRATLCMCLLLPMAAFAAEPAPQDAKAEAKPAKPAKPGATKQSGKASDSMVLSGMSIVGNDEAPKELVIVPWKSSQLGDAPGISRLLDDATQPVDKDVFMRELAYYGLKSAEPGDK